MFQYIREPHDACVHVERRGGGETLGYVRGSQHLLTLIVLVLDSWWWWTVVGDCLLLVMDSCWCWTVAGDCLLLVEEQLLAIHGCWRCEPHVLIFVSGPRFSKYFRGG